MTAKKSISRVCCYLGPVSRWHGAVAELFDRESELEAGPSVTAAQPVKMTPGDAKLFGNAVAPLASLVNPPGQRRLRLPRPTHLRLLRRSSHWDYTRAVLKCGQEVANRTPKNKNKKIQNSPSSDLWRGAQRARFAREQEALWKTRRQRSRTVKRSGVKEKLKESMAGFSKGWGQAGGGPS
jgi:hypothetical protein